MPVIRIDQEVFEALQKRAVPLVDTPNSALRKLLGLSDASENKRSLTTFRREMRRMEGATARETYRGPILRALSAVGGEAETATVLKRVEQIMGNNLTSADKESLPSGQRLRWQENAEWERYHMVTDGLLQSGSPRGIWEITDQGRRFLEARPKP